MCNLNNGIETSYRGNMSVIRSLTAISTEVWIVCPQSRWICNMLASVRWALACLSVVVTFWVGGVPTVDLTICWCVTFNFKVRGTVSHPWDTCREAIIFSYLIDTKESFVTPEMLIRISVG